jgi:hypothetical protein
LRFGTLAGAIEWPPKAPRFPPFDPVREAGARTDSAVSHRRCGAFGDERGGVSAMEAAASGSETLIESLQARLL